MLQVDFATFLDMPQPKHSSPMLVNIRGCNGSGKSTVPLEMLRQDDDAFEVTWEIDGKERVLATVFPRYEYLAVGKYATQCGGLDTMGKTEHIKLAAEYLWDTGYHIIMEGVLPSTVRQTYVDLFNSLNNSKSTIRDIVVFNLTPPLEVCLRRIQSRNGGKSIKEELVENKRKIVLRNHKHFEDAGFKSLCVDNSDVEVSSTLEWFFKTLGTNTPVKDDADCLIASDSKISHYEWYKHYVKPEGVEFNQYARDLFWQFITERQRIYYRRVVLEQPAPWTQDPVLLNYRFTNLSRDFDRISLYEIKHILSKLDEPGVDFETRKRSVLLNVFLYRLFVTVESYECFGGFIDVANKNWKEQVRSGYKRLLERKASGNLVFTSSFMVGSRHIADLNKESEYLNKDYNAFLIIERFMESMEEHYHHIVETTSLEYALNYIKGNVFGVGGFNAYEIVCSLAMSVRYCDNPMVEYTQDNYTNIGPGAKKGIKDIFVNKGNLTDIQAIIYLRSIWDLELKRLGIYEEFIEMLPKQFNNDIDLRIIEHMLCEFDKYYRVVIGKGRPKVRFRATTQNSKELLAIDHRVWR